MENVETKLVEVKTVRLRIRGKARVMKQVPFHNGNIPPVTQWSGAIETKKEIASPVNAQ